jgi:hypothetical protein
MATLKDELVAGLKARIQADVPASQFDPQNWRTTRLGLFYPANDTDVQFMQIVTALFTVFEPILIANDLGLSDESWRVYFFSITVNSTPNSAIERLLTVAGA